MARGTSSRRGPRAFRAARYSCGTCSATLSCRCADMSSEACCARSRTAKPLHGWRSRRLRRANGQSKASGNAAPSNLDERCNFAAGEPPRRVEHTEAHLAVEMAAPSSPAAPTPSPQRSWTAAAAPPALLSRTSSVGAALGCPSASQKRFVDCHARRGTSASSRQPAAIAKASVKDSVAPLSSPFSKSPSMQPSWFVTCARHTTGRSQACAKAGREAASISTVRIP